MGSWPCCVPATVAPSSARSIACRPGGGAAVLAALHCRRQLFRRLRAAFPGARLRVRLDGGFAGNELLAFLEAEQVEYVGALGRKRGPGPRAQPHAGEA